MNSRKVKQRTKRGFTNRRTKGKCEGKTGRTREEKRSSGYMEGEKITERMIYLKFGESRNFIIFIWVTILNKVCSFMELHECHQYFNIK